MIESTPFIVVAGFWFFLGGGIAFWLSDDVRWQVSAAVAGVLAALWLFWVCRETWA